jgi:hypothetical protein
MDPTNDASRSELPVDGIELGSEILEEIIHSLLLCEEKDEPGIITDLALRFEVTEEVITSHFFRFSRTDQTMQQGPKFSGKGIQEGGRKEMERSIDQSNLSSSDPNGQ